LYAAFRYHDAQAERLKIQDALSDSSNSFAQLCGVTPRVLDADQRVLALEAWKIDGSFHLALRAMRLCHEPHDRVRKGNGVASIDFTRVLLRRCWASQLGIEIYCSSESGVSFFALPHCQ